MWQPARRTVTAGSLCLLVKQSEAKWLHGPGTAVLSLQLPLMLSCSQQSTLTFYEGAVTEQWKKIYIIGICSEKFRHPDICHSCSFHLPQELLLYCCRNQHCPLKCRMAASFTLHSDYNDSSSYRGANLSIHLAEKCSTIMTSDPYFFSWERLLPVWIREWPAGT